MNNWGIGENNDIFKEPSRQKIKERKQKEFNNRQRSIMKTVGENMASLGCVLVVLLFVGYIWTDMKIQIFSERMLCDALASVVCFILIEDLMSQNGIKCGKLYDEYIVANKEYITLRDKVLALGISRLNAFCDWQVDLEYENYMRKKCRELKIEYDDYVKKYSKMSRFELRFHFRDRLKINRVYALRKIEPIELTPEMLMMLETGEYNGRGGIGISAEDYIKRKTRGAFNVIITVVTCVFSATIAFSSNEGASWGLVMYTMLKLALLCWRMYKGYSAGARAYNTIEVKHLQDKMLYLNLYVEFVEKKLYLHLKDRYCNQSFFSEDFDNEENKTESADPGGCAEGQSGGKLYHGTAESL